MPHKVVLGSRSPRRLELLRLVVPADRIEVLPPRSSREPGFEGLHDWPAIEERLLAIARGKLNDVRGQLRNSDDIVVTADTVIVAADPSGALHVLPQPPNDETYAETVRHWFRDFYAGRTHTAVTALCVSAGVRCIERVVHSQVTMTADVEQWLDWYIATGEPRGKAGGYALQGAGSLFVTAVTGSSSNVVGLPLNELMEAIAVLT